jgi:hypothetical protein
MNRNKTFLIFFAISLVASRLPAQISFTGLELNSDFNRGMEFFNKEKYPAAIKCFDSFLKSVSSEPTLRVQGLMNQGLPLAIIFIRTRITRKQ